MKIYNIKTLTIAAAQKLLKLGLVPKMPLLTAVQRKFRNPISYLGGPVLPARNRWSIESILSLD